MIKFHKYHGTGNDFIIIDNRDGKLLLNQKQISLLCHRNFGIGADGLMLLETSNQSAFKMRYYNSDGNEGSMCGNGGRCIVAFAKKLNIINNEIVFEAVDGIHHAEISNSEVRLKMNDVHGIEKIDNDFFLNTGSPHYVKWVNQLEDLDVVQEGRNIRYNNRFKNYGTNVNFIEQLDNQLLIRTYERGVENETLSCGTGNVAAAIVNSIDKENEYFSVNLKTKGGELNVTFQKTDAVTFKDVWLKGPAEFVFEGIY